MMDPAIRPDPLDGAFSAQKLMQEHFPPVEYVVPEVIPEGLTLLTAAPKIGKSWMVLLIALAAATGGHIFGSIPLQKRPVLYLALEDGPRRLQDRLRTLGAPENGESGLVFLTTLQVSAPQVIQTFLDRHPGEKPLIILDTLGKVRGVYNGNDAYQKDYGQMSMLKDAVDDHPGSSLIVVHHTRKAETADFLDSISGTQGLAGAADSVLVIRRERQTGEAALHVTSRDAAEGEYAMTFTDGVWSLDGHSLADAAEAVERRKATSGVGDDMTQIVQKLGHYPHGVKAGALAQDLGMQPDTTGRYLRRAVEAGRAVKLTRGLYGPVRSVRSVRSEASHTEEPDTTDSSDTLTTGMELTTNGFCQRIGCSHVATQGRKYCTGHDSPTERPEVERQEVFL